MRQLVPCTCTAGAHGPVCKRNTNMSAQKAAATQVVSFKSPKLNFKAMLLNYGTHCNQSSQARRPEMYSCSLYRKWPSALSALNSHQAVIITPDQGHFSRSASTRRVNATTCKAVLKTQPLPLQPLNTGFLMADGYAVVCRRFIT